MAVKLDAFKSLFEVKIVEFSWIQKQTSFHCQKHDEIVPFILALVILQICFILLGSL